MSRRRTVFGSPFRLGASLASLAADAERRQRNARVFRATATVAIVLGAGTYGFWWFADQRYSLVECLYMTVITVATVGFEEAIPINTDALRSFVIGLILLGGGSLVYFFSAVASSVIEGDLLYGVWRRGMLSRLRRLRDHIIVVGLGRTGMRAADELVSSRQQLLVVEEDAEKIEALIGRYGESLMFIVADGLIEETLHTAGVQRAGGLVAALNDDRDNLLLCVTARQLNPHLRIVSKVVGRDTAGLFRDIGVDAIAQPATIGGVRLANELVRPDLLLFTDAVLAADAHRRFLGEIAIAPDSVEAGRALAEAQLEQRTGCVIVGIRYMASGPYRYYPAPNSPLEADGAVMALGDRRQLAALRRLLARGPRRFRLPRPLGGRGSHE